MYLLDSHVLVWLDTDPSRLSETSHAILQNLENRVYVSSITILELSIKYRLGKLPQVGTLLQDYPTYLTRYALIELPFRGHHAMMEAKLSSSHKDPFDRALVTQALADDLILITKDSYIREFTEIQTLW